MKSKGPCHAKMCHRAYADSECPDQTAHARSLIWAAVHKQNHWILRHVSMESKCLNETLRMRRMRWIRTFCACSKALFRLTYVCSVCSVLICSSSLLLLVPREGCSSWLRHFLGIFTYIFTISFLFEIFMISLSEMEKSFQNESRCAQEYLIHLPEEALKVTDELTRLSQFAYKADSNNSGRIKNKSFLLLCTRCNDMIRFLISSPEPKAPVRYYM